MIIGSLSRRPKQLGYLPLLIKGANGNLIVDRMRDHEIRPAYDLIKTASIPGNNIGLDEHSCLANFEFFLRQCQAFVVRKDERDTSMEGVFAIGPARLARGLSRCISEFHMFSPRGPQVVTSLIPVCERLAKDLGLGYTRSMVQVANPCHDWISQLEDFGYQTTAIIPASLTFKDLGVVDSLAMDKELTVEHSQPLNRSDVLEHPLLHYYKEQYDAGVACNPRPVPFLPLKYILDDGRVLLLRNMEDGESETVFKLLQEQTLSAKNGIGRDEFPTFYYFKIKYLKDNFVIVVRLESKPDIIGVILWRPVPFLRRDVQPSHSVFIWVNSLFKGHGYFSAMMKIIRGMTYRLGITQFIGTAAESSVLHLMDKIKNINATNDGNVGTDGYLGRIEKGIYLENQGWADLTFATTYMTEKDMIYLNTHTQ